MSLVRTGLGAIALIAALLSGCSGGSKGGHPTASPSSVPQTTTSTSASPSPTGTGPLTTGSNMQPGEKPPVFPSLAKRRTQLGAIAFGGFYFRALDWSVATNDDALVRSISTPGCLACKRVSAAVRELRQKHEIETGGRITIREFANVLDRHFSTKSDYVIRVTYDEGAVRLSRAGAPAKVTVPAVRRASSYVFVSWIGGRWRVVEVEQA